METLKQVPDDVLVVGKGEGVVDDYLLKQNISVLSVDIDERYEPDVCGDVRFLSSYINKKFDVVLCCEVLEHIPFPEVQKCLYELWRATKRCLILSVPYNGWCFNISLDMPLFHDKNYCLYVDHKKKLLKGKHQWELNRARLRYLQGLLNGFFDKVYDYRCSVFPYVHFFICEVSG
jgi:hypothetical protein